MGGRQAASVLLQVRLDALAREGRTMTEDEQAAFTAPTLETYERQGSPYYSTARLWDDGIIDPVDTRRVLGLGLAGRRAQRADPGDVVRRLPDVARRRVFSSVLVANRGEIALRVMRTCARLGIRTIAVALRRRCPVAARARRGRGRADRARARRPSRTCGRIALLEAARATGAEAIHPGYGFLAESASFAEAVIDAGLAWIGPPPAAMRALGDKARAKALAIASDVPVLAGLPR